MFRPSSPTTTQVRCGLLGRWVKPIVADQAVTVMDDSVAVVQEFQELETAAHLTWVDIDGEEPNVPLNFGDIQMIVQGLKHQPYPLSAPVECP